LKKEELEKLREHLLLYKINPSQQSKTETIQMAKAELQLKIKDKTRLSELFLTQAKHLSKFLWAGQLLAIIITVLNFHTIQTNHDVLAILFTAVPILGFYTVPEIIKSRVYGMSELESVCQISPIKNMFIKLILVGTINLIMILLMLLLLHSKWEGSFAHLIVFGLIPFNFINVMNLYVLNVFKLKSPFVFISISLITSIMIHVLTIYFSYNSLIWGISFIISTCLLIFELLKLLSHMTKRKDFLWN
jgi:hypothetical protein